ncbi:MAG: hypothetical protein R3B49_02395 [Phycisphaerales bacterium]
MLVKNPASSASSRRRSRHVHVACPPCASLHADGARAEHVELDSTHERPRVRNREFRSRLRDRAGLVVAPGIRAPDAQHARERAMPREELALTAVTNADVGLEPVQERRPADQVRPGHARAQPDLEGPPEHTHRQPPVVVTEHARVGEPVDPGGDAVESHAERADRGVGFKKDNAAVVDRRHLLVRRRDRPRIPVRGIVPIPALGHPGNALGVRRRRQ